MEKELVIKLNDDFIERFSKAVGDRNLLKPLEIRVNEGKTADDVIHINFVNPAQDDSKIQYVGECFVDTGNRQIDMCGDLLYLNQDNKEESLKEPLISLSYDNGVITVEFKNEDGKLLAWQRSSRRRII